MRYTLRTSLAVALALAAATGCGKKDDASTADTAGGTVATTPAPAPAPAGFRVANVQLGRAVGADKRITAAADTFGVRDTIFVSVATEGTAGGTVVARWLYQDGQTVDSTSQQLTGAGVTEFHIAKPSGWPKGTYRVEILTDGIKADERTFTIR